MHYSVVAAAVVVVVVVVAVMVISQYSSCCTINGCIYHAWKCYDMKFCNLPAEQICIFIFANAYLVFLHGICTSINLYLILKKKMAELIGASYMCRHHVHPVVWTATLAFSSSRIVA